MGIARAGEQSIDYGDTSQRPPSPKAGDIYIDTEQKITLHCYTDGTWVYDGGPGFTTKAGTRVVSAGGWAAWGIVAVPAAAGTIYCQPIFIQRQTAFVGFGLNIQTAAAAGSLARCAIYNWKDGGLGSLVLDGGTVSTASTGNKVITIAQTLQGWYWACVVCDNTPNLGGIDTSLPFHSPTGGRINAYSSNLYGLIGSVTGKTAYVAAGFPTTGDALAGYTTADYAVMKFTE